MAHFVTVCHKVKDFAAWKKVYDAHAPARKAAGLTEKYLLRNADNPNETFILFEAADLAKAKAFATSPDLKETMQKAGVIDQPTVMFLNS